MTAATSRRPLLSVSVGNTSIACGLFTKDCLSDGLPVPEESVILDVDSPAYDRLEHLLAREKCNWSISSVNRQAAAALREWLGKYRQGDPIRLVSYEDLPISIDVPRPERVGVDRLAAAAAANRIRSEGHPALVVDAGTAITLDAISGEGHFLGGAILPGPRVVLTGLNREADLLPLLRQDDIAAEPDVIGKDTNDAIFSGVHWGAIGAVRELSQRILSILGESAEIFLTGNGIHRVSRAFPERAVHVPHLVLSGTALARFADSNE